MRGLARETRGVIYAEFLIAFTPIFLFFLGLGHREKAPPPGGGS